MEKIKRKSGMKYREMIRVNGRAIKSPVFTRKYDANLWKSKKIADKQNLMIHGNQFRPSMKLSEFISEWLEKKVKVQNSNRTLENYMSDIKNHIIPEMGHVGIGFINPNLATELISKLRGKGLSNRTINKVLTVLKTILNDAHKWEYLSKNPIFAYPELKVQQKPDVFLTDLEIQRLIMASHGGPVHDIIVTALNSGLRLGEILGLQFDRINLPMGQIEITRTLTRHGIQETTKTSKKRVLPLNPTLKILFRKLWQEQKSPKWVFCKKDGSPFDVNHISQRDFKRALLKADLPHSVRFHDLRHVFASHFVMKGGDIFVLQKILGHSSIEMTQRYAHMSQKYLSEASQIVHFQAETGNNAPDLNHSGIIEGNFRVSSLGITAS